jgi:hypothetical protein
MRLTADEFIRRFLLHVLPQRFVRIRHYGLLAGRNVSTKLVHCQQLLGVPVSEPACASERTSWLDRLREWTGQDWNCCPQCQGQLVRHSLETTSTIPASHPRPPIAHAGVDSS